MSSDKHNDQMPLISVVIATANRRNWVHEAINSVLAQTYPQIELIVVDDGSTDGTYESVSNLYGSQITLIKSNGGNAPSAKNRGAEIANGEFLAFLDDDDLWYPQKIEKQLKLMERTGQAVGAVGAGCDYIDSDGNPILKPTPPTSQQATYEQCCIRVSLPGSGSNNLIRRALFEELGRFDEKLTRGEDRDLWIKIARTHQILLHPEILCSIRIHDTARRGVDLKVIEQNRKVINRRIPEPGIRRIAQSWMYFCLFQRAWSKNKRSAFRYLLKSFLLQPFSKKTPGNRAKDALNQILNR